MTSPLTASQIKWAKSHDWYIGMNASGFLVVADRYTKGGEHFEDIITWRKSFKALRAWAGY